MHAAVRRILLENPAHTWDVAKRGIPINQEDLLYTWVSFTDIVLDALARVSIEIDPASATSYLNAWRVVGRAIGIDPDFIPTSLEETRQLRRILETRNQRASHGGREMTRALAGLIGEVLGPLGWLRWSLLHFLIGDERARVLGVPSQPVRERLVAVTCWLLGNMSQALTQIQPLQGLLRLISLRLIQHYVNLEISGAKRPFRVPESLQVSWRGRK
jgi:hypothetical protein